MTESLLQGRLQTEHTIAADNDEILQLWVDAHEATEEAERAFESIAATLQALEAALQSEDIDDTERKRFLAAIETFRRDAENPLPHEPTA